MKKARTETEYQQLHKRTGALLADLKAAIADLPAAGRGSMDERLDGVGSDLHAPLRVAVAGEYDVGKSTVIMALSGDTSIHIDADVTTNQPTLYKYEDIELVDLPGTLSGFESHDRLAMRAIVDCDLLLFVLSNELFNPSSLGYFNDAIHRFKKTNQTMLLVNQFDRVNLRDRTDEEAIALMTEALQEMIGPAKVSDFRPTFVSARDYCDAMRISDAQGKDDMIRSSRMSTLRTSLNEFCKDKGIYGRFARPVQVIAAIASECLQATTEDKDERVAFNYLERREQILLQELAAWRDKTRNLCVNVRAAIRRCAEPVLVAVEQKLGPNEVDAAYQEANSEIEHLVAKTEKETEDMADMALRSLSSRLSGLDNTPVGKRVMDWRVGGQSGLGFDIKAPTSAKQPSQKNIDLLASGMRRAGEALTKNASALGKGAAEKLRLVIKYKPWGKIKMAERVAKCLGRAGKILGPLAIGLEIYTNYRHEENREKEEHERLQCKASIRANFVEYGDATYAGLAQVLARFEDEVLKVQLDCISEERNKLQQRTKQADKVRSLLVQISDTAQKLLQSIPVV